MYMGGENPTSLSQQAGQGVRGGVLCSVCAIELAVKREVCTWGAEGGGWSLLVTAGLPPSLHPGGALHAPSLPSHDALDAVIALAAHAVHAAARPLLLRAPRWSV